MLVLYIIGKTDISLATRTIKVTNKGKNQQRNFTENDYNLVEQFIEYFDIIITTPHILTETSDLLGNRSDLHEMLKYFIDNSIEKYECSRKLSDNDYFFRFGLADSSIIAASENPYLVFTADKPLYGYLCQKGIDTVNFDTLISLNS